MYGAARSGVLALIVACALLLSASGEAGALSPPKIPSSRNDAKYCGEVFDDGAYDVDVYITKGRRIFTCKHARAVVHAAYASRPSGLVRGWTRFDWSGPGHGFRWLQAWERDDGRVVVGTYYRYVPD